MRSSPNIRFMLAALGLIFIDQITKVVVKGFSLFGIEHAGMELGESITVIDGFLWWTFVENPGMAFGLEFGEAKILLSLFSIVASVLLGWYLWRTRIDSFWAKLGLTLVLAGASGNLIDRVFYGWIYDYAPLFYGKVVDFVEVEFFDFSLFGRSFTTWPVFNVADSCVTVGMIVLILNTKHLTFLHDKKDTEDSSPQDKQEGFAEAEGALQEGAAEESDENNTPSSVAADANSAQSQERTPGGR